MTNSSRSAKGQEPCLRVIPLGGLHEIGKHTCVFAYGADLLLVDAGPACPGPPTAHPRIRPRPSMSQTARRRRGRAAHSFVYFRVAWPARPCERVRV